MASITLPTRVLTAALFTLIAWAANPATTQAQLPDYLPTDGLVGWWPFNGNANDESGNGNDGVVNGATLTEDRDGNPNAAYSFDGESDYISIANHNTLNPLDGVTISAWVVIDDVQSNNFNRIVSKQFDGLQNFGSYQLITGSGSSFGTAGFTVRTGPGNTQTLPGIYGWTGNNGVSITNQFQHALGTFDGSQLKFYQNGVLVSTVDLSGSLFYDEQDLLFGKGKSGAVFPGVDSFFSGVIDDIAIYNRALTPEEITALYTGIPYVAPCADPTACNFEQEGECVFAEPNLDCAGNCLNDCNNNGVCDEDEVYGCTYAFACNYDPNATTDDGTCAVAIPNYDCDGNCLLDLNNNGLCDLEEFAGCTNIDAINYNADATLDDGSCMVTCKGDFDNDGLISTPDLLAFLAAFGNQCAGAGCMDPAGCNYDPNATFDLGYCEYPDEFFNCEGAPINDADGDGIPDELEVAGCTDPEAGNYNPEATDDDGSCTFGLTGSTHSCGAENVHNPDLVYGSVTDIDGNTYRTIVIGEQEWMAENLTVEHYANGDPIPNVTDNAQWANLSTGAWCYYNNDPQFECPYGKLYNWYVTVDDRNVCPTGWHVPTDAEYTILTNYLGGEEAAGGKMKSTGLQYWASPNGAATNESGFSGLPGGYRGDVGGVLVNVGYLGYWWSSTEDDTSSAWTRNLLNGVGYVVRNNYLKEIGFSVRCLRD